MSLAELMLASKNLSKDEKLELALFLIEQVRYASSQENAESQGNDLVGEVPYRMVGEDAQEWVSRTRAEEDERIDRWDNLRENKKE